MRKTLFSNAEIVFRIRRGWENIFPNIQHGREKFCS